MYFGNNDYLRVMSPRTVDGANVMFDENDQRVWREDFLPMSAKRDLELLNEKLPDQLKKKIIVVSAKPLTVKRPIAQPTPQPSNAVVAEEIEDEEEETLKPATTNTAKAPVTKK